VETIQCERAKVRRKEGEEKRVTFLSIAQTPMMIFFSISTNKGGVALLTGEEHAEELVEEGEGDKRKDSESKNKEEGGR
jgi:hypothetical protein